MIERFVIHGLIYKTCLTTCQLILSTQTESVNFRTNIILKPMNEADKVAVKVNSYTVILIRKDKDKTTAVDTFLKRWNEFQEDQAKHCDPWLSQ